MPPASLKDIHFNDPIRHIIFAEESIASPARGSDPGALDRLGRNVDAVFLTSRGKIASMKNGNALAITGNEFRLFDSLADYRDAYRDSAQWTEQCRAGPDHH